MSKGCGKKGNSHLSCVITPPRKYNDNIVYIHDKAICHYHLLHTCRFNQWSGVGTCGDEYKSII